MLSNNLVALFSLVTIRVAIVIIITGKWSRLWVTRAGCTRKRTDPLKEQVVVSGSLFLNGDTCYCY